MKKGMLGLALLAILFFGFSQAAFAVNNVQLNVNAGGTTANPNANKHYWFDTSTSANTKKTNSVGWTEKVLYSEASNIQVTVKNNLEGYLVVRADVVTLSTSTGIIVSSLYFQYAESDSNIMRSLELSAVEYDVAGKSLSDLALSTTKIASGTTLTLLNFVGSSDLVLPGYVVISAYLLNNLTTTPQVMGFDSQTIFFNYLLPAVTATTVTSGSGITLTESQANLLTIIQSNVDP